MDKFFSLLRTIIFVLMSLQSPSAEDTIGQPDGKPYDYCQWEHFNPDCGPKHVVNILTAEYGYRKSSRCTKTDHGSLPDKMQGVLEVMDYKCSGRSTCRVSGYDSILRTFKTTNLDVAAHIEIRYVCLQVQSGKRSECQSKEFLKIDASTPGYIAAQETIEHGYGDSKCPWRLVTDHGRTLNISLVNFAQRKFEVDENGDLIKNQAIMCFNVGETRELGEHSKPITMCNGKPRESSIYLSRTNAVTIEIENSATIGGIGRFLIKYESIGCPNIPKPDGGFVQRDRDTATIHCNNTGQTRYLTCTQNDWVGEIITSCDPDSSETSGIIDPNRETFPYGILLVVSIGVALGVFLGGLLLSVVIFYLRRRKRRRRAEREHEMDDHMDDESKYITYEPHPHHHHHHIHTPIPSTHPHSFAVLTTDPSMKNSTVTRTAPGVEQTHIISADRGSTEPSNTIKGNLPYGHVEVMGLTESGPGYRPHRHLYESPRFT